jgi:hypothetical protein
VTSPDDTTEVAVQLARAMERAGVEYAVGGSVASSAYGEPRATRDLDFAVRLTPRLVPSLLESLGPDFVVDSELLLEGIRTGRSVNIFFLPFFTKIDLFVRGDDEYDRAEFSRRNEIEVVPGERILASSPEDNLLWKLRWYRKGGEVSDQQWRDVLGLLRVSGETMDLAYLRSWAMHHSVDDLLEQAMSQGTI